MCKTWNLALWLSSLANGSVPLDVPASNANMTSTKLAPSLEGDSGFCGEQSYSSLSSGPPSMSLWDSRHENGNLLVVYHSFHPDHAVITVFRGVYVALVGNFGRIPKFGIPRFHYYFIDRSVIGWTKSQ